MTSYLSSFCGYICIIHFHSKTTLPHVYVSLLDLSESYTTQLFEVLGKWKNGKCVCSEVNSSWKFDLEASLTIDIIGCVFTNGQLFSYHQRWNNRLTTEARLFSPLLRLLLPTMMRHLERTRIRLRSSIWQLKKRCGSNRNQ